MQAINKQKYITLALAAATALGVAQQAQAQTTTQGFLSDIPAVAFGHDARNKVMDAIGVNPGSMFGIGLGASIEGLATGFIKKDVTKWLWNKNQDPLTDEILVADIEFVRQFNGYGKKNKNLFSQHWNVLKEVKNWPGSHVYIGTRLFKSVRDPQNALVSEKFLPIDGKPFIAAAEETPDKEYVVDSKGMLVRQSDKKSFNINELKKNMLEMQKQGCFEFGVLTKIPADAYRTYVIFSRSGLNMYNMDNQRQFPGSKQYFDELSKGNPVLPGSNSNTSLPKFGTNPPKSTDAQSFINSDNGVQVPLNNVPSTPSAPSAPGTLIPPEASDFTDGSVSATKTDTSTLTPADATVSPEPVNTPAAIVPTQPMPITPAQNETINDNQAFVNNNQTFVASDAVADTTVKAPVQAPVQAPIQAPAVSTAKALPPAPVAVTSANSVTPYVAHNNKVLAQNLFAAVTDAKYAPLKAKIVAAGEESGLSNKAGSIHPGPARIVANEKSSARNEGKKSLVLESIQMELDALDVQKPGFMAQLRALLPGSTKLYAQALAKTATVVAFSTEAKQALTVNVQTRVASATTAIIERAQQRRSNGLNNAL